jgi:hypothetical protein
MLMPLLLEKSTDALSLSTKVGPVTLGMYTTNGGIAGTKHVTSTTHVSIAADIDEPLHQLT